MRTAQENVYRVVIQEHFIVPKVAGKFGPGKEFLRIARYLFLFIGGGKVLWHKTCCVIIGDVTTWKIK